MNYAKTFTNNNKINANIGASASSTHSKGMKQLHRGYFKDYGEKFVAPEDIDRFPEYKNWLISDAAQPKRMNDLLNQVSVFATFSYTWKNNLTLGLNGRTDGSNRFGKKSNERILPVWSLSGSYDFSALLSNIDWLNYLYLRSSYGEQGNMLKDQSPETIIKRFSADPYYNESLVKIERYPNPNLRWEKTGSFSSEIDFALLNNRIQGTFSYYNKRTKDAFLRVDVDLVNGYPSYVVNSGNLKNHGYSMSLSFVPLKGTNYNWRVSTSFSKNFNQLNSKPEYNQFTINNFLNGTAQVENKPLGTFYSYKFIGLNPQDGGLLYPHLIGLFFL